MKAEAIVLKRRQSYNLAKKKRINSPNFLQRDILTLFGEGIFFKRLVICDHRKRNFHFCKCKLRLNSDKMPLESAQLQY